LQMLIAAGVTTYADSAFNRSTCGSSIDQAGETGQAIALFRYSGEAGEFGEPMVQLRTAEHYG